MTLPETGIVLITGENGVGKSTLCSYIYDQKLIDGDLVWTESQQFRSIYPIKVESILSLFQKNALSLDTERFRKISSLFDLDSWKSRTWEELSSGQGQMLKLLMGLSLKAKTYILDEPAHFLDKNKLGSLSIIVRDISLESLVIIIDHRIDWLEASIFSRYSLQNKSKTVSLEQV